MKKIKFQTSIPAQISGFTVMGNSHLSKATLKVFHMGDTSDGRRFSKKFADKLAATIGGTPVVARFDLEELDFIGHADEQSVFGFVPEEPEVKFEEVDGQNWLITEIRLFTERHDVGRIAKKIVGHSQSLELRPDSVEVDFHENEDGSTTVEFLDGDLIGLSVLGTEQVPAFTGSEFFTEANAEDLIPTVEDLIRKYNAIATELEVEVAFGGEEMKKEIVFENDYVIVYRSEDGQEFVEELKDGQLDSVEDAIGEGSEEPTEPTDPEDPNDGGDTPEDGDDTPEDGGEGEGEEGTGEGFEGEGESKEEDEGEEFSDSENENEEGDENFEPETNESEEDGVEPKTEEVPTDEIALNQAERQELENYRREHKVSIINEYKEFLSDEVYQKFIKGVDSYTLENLPKELSFESMQALKNNRDSSSTTGSFSFNMPTSFNRERETDDVAEMIIGYNEKQ